MLSLQIIIFSQGYMMDTEFFLNTNLKKGQMLIKHKIGSFWCMS